MSVLFLISVLPAFAQVSPAWDFAGFARFAAVRADVPAAFPDADLAGPLPLADFVLRGVRAAVVAFAPAAGLDSAADSVFGVAWDADFVPASSGVLVVVSLGSSGMVTTYSPCQQISVRDDLGR